MLYTFVRIFESESMPDLDLSEHEPSFAKHAETFKKTHLNELAKYKTWSAHTNNHLRGRAYDQPSSTLLKRIAILDHITSHKFEKPAILYRGVSFSEHLNMKHGINLNGGTRTDPGFMSTTTSPTVAQNFAHNDGINNTGHSTLLRIHVPAGARGYHIDRHAVNKHSSEKEVLLARGTTLKYHDSGETKTHHFMRKMWDGSEKPDSVKFRIIDAHVQHDEENQ